ncbi:MAG: hypothetical protein QNL33_08250 [Akkermansiaceae bacterium]
MFVATLVFGFALGILATFKPPLLKRQEPPALLETLGEKTGSEFSALFENALLSGLDSHPDLTCAIPLTKSGKSQRSGYPDLRVKHLPSGTIAYLDPKLFASHSRTSTLRTFYFEPGGETSKITEDALHLLLGFPHDSKTRAWTFDQAELVDLSQLTVTLKTEFSASNKEVYALPTSTNH